MAVDTGQQMQQLYQRFGELPGVVIELHKELLAVHIQNDAATATVFLQGAQLSQYQAKGQPASIWCSDSCDYKAGCAVASLFAGPGLVISPETQKPCKHQYHTRRITYRARMGLCATKTGC